MSNCHTGTLSCPFPPERMIGSKKCSDPTGNLTRTVSLVIPYDLFTEVNNPLPCLPVTVRVPPVPQWGAHP